MPRIPLLLVSLGAAVVLVACDSSQATVPTDGSGGGTTQTATSDQTAPADTTSASSQDFFDDTSVVHAVSVEFAPADYDAMMATFVSTGEKEWIAATMTIDGRTYENVGLRLKGNSSLNALRGRGGPASTSGATASEPESLPWLIRLDKFVEGQDDNGRVDIVVRSNNSQTSLNEAVALDLLAAAGLASQEAVSTSFSVNGSDPVLRLAIEHPDEGAWQDEAFEGDGALYKAESSGDWSYRGADPASYDEIFDQEGGKKVADLTPLIEFLDFINNTDDATFASELPERLDVDAFARYLAMMDLLANFDDVDGPGNNSYLWYDVDSGKFTIVPWDMNLAFGAMMGGGGGMDRGGFGQAPGGALPGGGAMPGGNGGQRGGFGQSNPLVTRFHANATFEALYQQQLTALRAELFDSGAASDLLAARVATLLAGARNLVAAATVQSEAAAIEAQFSTP